MKMDDHFFHQLLNETYELIDNQAMAEDFEEQEVFALEYLEKWGVFRLKCQNIYLDFPKNWSIFEMLYRAKVQCKVFIAPLGRSCDYYLRDIVKSFLAVKEYHYGDFAFVTYNGKSFLVADQCCEKLREKINETVLKEASRASSSKIKAA